MLEVSPSGYYSFVKRRGVYNYQINLIVRLREAHLRSRNTYGSRRLVHQLQKEGIVIGRYRVRKLMKLAGIRAQKRQRYKTTTNSNHRYPVSANLVGGCFEADRPNQLWVSDITYIRTLDGWLYLAVVMDLFSRKIVGWSLSEKMTVELVKAALYMAIGRRKPCHGLIHHSDRGSQYASWEYRRLLEAHGLVSSMSRSGNCLDNAVAERFFATLKGECQVNWKEMTAREVRWDIVDYIEMFYNSERLHSYNGYLSPNDYETRELVLV